MYLNEELQQLLRAEGVIQENEVVSKEGDLFIAVNVVSNQRRIINVSKRLIEGKDTSRLLKG
jgi:hypothetical protein